MANKEALRQLRRVVAKAPKHSLHMNRVVDQSDCGTARCAIGWAAVDKWFQENTKLNELIDPGVTYQTNIGDIANIAGIFDISVDNATKLFGGGLSPYGNGPHDVSKKEVLWNIDRLLEGKPARSYEAVAEFRRSNTVVPKGK